MLSFEKKRTLRKFLREWGSYSSMQNRIRNENVLERLLFNKMCLTYGTTNKKNAFDHRLRERCRADRSYRYKSSRVHLTLDELYAESLKRKTFKVFFKVLKARKILRKQLDIKLMAMRKLRDLVGIDPAEF